MKIIVTAGGQGTKLWPYSREDRPKQFQPVVGDVTPYQQTIQTLLKKYPPEDIFISIKRKFIKYASEQSPQIPLKNYIIEPDIKRDRGPAEGLAFLRLSLQYPDEPFFLVQSDCAHTPEDAFLQMIEDAGKLVERDRKFISGGMKATEPNLGVDYLSLGAQVDSDSSQEVYEVDTFIGRKASYAETKRLIENFHIVLHCNHSCWYPGLMLEAYKQYRPDWHEALMKIRDAIDQPGEDAAIEAIYAEMATGATEEVTRQVMQEQDARIILLPYKWTDIGTWGSVYDFFTDGDGTDNYADGTVVAVASKGSIIKSSNERKLIAIAGLENMVVIDTDDVLLVVPAQKIEMIKDIQATLQAEGKQQYL